MKTLTKTPKNIQSSLDKDNIAGSPYPVIKIEDTNQTDDEILKEVCKNDWATQNKEHLTDTDIYNLLKKAIALTREACQIECEECHRKDCLNVLCHADLEVIKQDERKEGQKAERQRILEIIDKVTDKVEGENPNGENVARIEYNNAIWKLQEELKKEVLK